MRNLKDFTEWKETMTVKQYNENTNGFCDPYQHNGNVYVYENTFHIEIHQHHYYLTLDRGEYMEEKTEVGLNKLEQLLFEFVEDEFPDHPTCRNGKSIYECECC